MPQISRQIGQTSQKLNVFVQDATVTTGVGLANVIASSVSFGWCRDDQATISSGTATNSTILGTWSSAAWTQLSSTAMLGWYQFGAPDGIFTSGSLASIHFYGIPSGAVVPTLVELTKTNNQQYASSTNFSSASNVVAPVGSSSQSAGVNVTSIAGSGAVTSGAGVLSITGSVSVSSMAIGVNVTSIAGSGPVTSGAGVLSVTGSVSASSVTVGVNASSVTGGVNVTSIVNSAAVTTAAGILAYTFDLGRTANQTSVVAFPGVTISTQAVVVGGVNVTSIAGSPPVTSAAGVLLTSTDLAGINGIANSIPASTHALIGSSTYPFSIRASSVAGTIPQIMYEVMQNNTNFTNAGTSRTLNNLAGQATNVTYQYDNSTQPNAITRVA